MQNGSNAGIETVRLVEKKCAHLLVHGAVRGVARGAATACADSTPSGWLGSSPARRRWRASCSAGSYGEPEGTCTPQAFAACLNAGEGDWKSVVLLRGKYSPLPIVRPGP